MIFYIADVNEELKLWSIVCEESHSDNAKERCIYREKMFDIMFDDIVNANDEIVI